AFDLRRRRPVAKSIIREALAPGRVRRHGRDQPVQTVVSVGHFLPRVRLLRDLAIVVIRRVTVLHAPAAYRLLLQRLARPGGSCAGYVIDHIEALKRGGADSPDNMQWQSR